MRIVWPASLTLLRLILGPVAVWCGLAATPRWVFLPLLLAGMLSDIFDGVLARRLGVSRPWLRRFDSMTDVVFYLCVLAATWIVEPVAMKSAVWPMVVLLASEAACIFVSLLKFGVTPATHCYSAKFYGLVLFGSFVAVLCFGAGAVVLDGLVVVGLLANAEVISILLLSPTAPVDVPTVFLLRRQTRPGGANEG